MTSDVEEQRRSLLAHSRSYSKDFVSRRFAFVFVGRRCLYLLALFLSMSFNIFLLLLAAFYPHNTLNIRSFVNSSMLSSPESRCVSNHSLSSSICAVRSDSIASANLSSDGRGYMAILYSGQARTFSAVFHTHIMFLFALSPYTVHLYFHLNIDGNHEREFADNSDLASVTATLRYYSHYYNLDHQLVSIQGSIKHWSTTDLAAPNIWKESEHFSSFKAILPRMAKDNDASNIMWAAHSLYRANRARIAYEKQHNMHYDLVWRVRLDFYFKSDPWPYVFVRTPRLINSVIPSSSVSFSNENAEAGSNNTTSDSKERMNRWISDGTSVYNLHDLQYRSVFNTSKAILVPGCESWWGVCDQFAIGNGHDMTIYAERAVNATFIYTFKKQYNKWVFHAETFLRDVLAQSAIRAIEIHICYSVPRTILFESLIGQVYFTPTRCKWGVRNIGKECCEQFCPFIVARDEETRQLYGKYSNASLAVEDQLIAYVQSLPVQWRLTPLSSSFSHFYLYADVRALTGCKPELWPNTLDPFQYHRFPFIVVDEHARRHYELSRRCATSDV